MEQQRAHHKANNRRNKDDRIHRHPDAIAHARRWCLWTTDVTLTPCTFRPPLPTSREATLSNPRPAICPNCGEQGDEIGVRCTERVCSKKGYNFIASEYVEPVADGEAPDLDPMIGRLVDEYLIVKTLGAGGFGKVYLVLQQPIMLKAALKLVHGHLVSGELGERLLDKFKGEARALAQLTHPNIVRLLKFGVHHQSPYMVMEYVADACTLGKEIAERAAVKRGMSPREVAHILGQVVDGLGAAHRKGLVHRDIKPDNIMLQAIEGNSHFVRILDFGLAKDLTVSNETSVAMGTPAYMAPEQIRRRDLGPWTDWYALGIIAFELLTGRAAFGDATGDSLFQLKLDDEFDPTLGLPPDAIHPTALAFLRKACAPLIDARFRTAEEFRAGLMTAVHVLADASHREAPPPLTALVDTNSDTVMTPSQQQQPVASAPLDPLQAAKKALKDESKSSTRDEAKTQSAPQPLSSEPSPFESTPLRPRGRAGLAALAVLLMAGITIPLLWPKGPPTTPQAPAPHTLAEVAQIRDVLGSKHSPGSDGTSSSRPNDAGPNDADIQEATENAAAPEPLDLNAMSPLAAGSYPIGCQPDDRRCWDDEKPGHQATLGPIEVMTFEVTHGAYEACVSAKKCKARDPKSRCVPPKTTPADAPATCITFAEASTYCASRSMRLPTEQEWEAAARGANHPQYPWGDDGPTCSSGMFKECGTFPFAVGSAPGDKSWAGVRDLGGSVREWTSSRPLPYPGSKTKQPRTSRKAGRVTRGGSWMIPVKHAPSALYRMAEAKESRLQDLGFRCVKDAEGR